MSASPPATPGAVLDRDVVCLSCGYNLRGLAPDSSCPECGRAVADSLRGGGLLFADPLWIDRLANGAGWVAVGQLLSVFSCDVSGTEPLTIFLFEVLPVGVLLFGVWRFTTPEWSRFTPARYENVRRWVRPAVAAWSTVWLSALLMNSGVKVWLDPVVAILGGLAILAVCRLGHELALRMEEPALAKEARILGRSWLGLACALMTAEILAALLLQPPGPNAMGTMITLGVKTYVVDPWLDRWLGIPMVAAGICFLLFGLWLLILPFTFRSRLRRLVPAGADGRGWLSDAR